MGSWSTCLWGSSKDTPPCGREAGDQTPGIRVCRDFILGGGGGLSLNFVKIEQNSNASRGEPGPRSRSGGRAPRPFPWELNGSLGTEDSGRAVRCHTPVPGLWANRVLSPSSSV